MKINNTKPKRLCDYKIEDIDGFDISCIGQRIDKNSKNWHIHQILKVGQKGLCTSEDLSLFLPDFPTPHGSEPYFCVNGSDVSGALLPDLIRGCHLIEMKYIEDTGYENGFGSPSPTNYLINCLMKTDKNKAIDLYNWIAANGGNYYITPNVIYKEK